MNISDFDPVLKPILIYLGALGMVRLVGKRALGELSLFDLVVMAMIGDVITVVGLERTVPLVHGLFFLGILGGMEIVFSLLVFRYPRWARRLEGAPTLLINKGTVNKKNLRQENISINDLRQELRKHGVDRMERVERAYLEANGKFSVILDASLPREVDDPRWEKVFSELRLIRQLLEERKRSE